MSIDPYAYSVNVCRIKLDGEWLFRATVAELPDVATFEDTHEAAYSLAIEAIESLYEANLERGRPFPEPRSNTESLGYSGRLTLRMPRWLHAQLGAQADAEGISLNQYLISILSAAGSINALVQEASEKIGSITLAHSSAIFRRAFGGTLADSLNLPMWAPYGAMQIEGISKVVAKEDTQFWKAEARPSSTFSSPSHETYLISGNC